MKKIIFAFVAAALIAGSPLSVMALDVDETGNTIVSPYWQANKTGSVVTMIAVTNPSTSGATSRAVTLSAVTEAGVTLGSTTVGVGIGQTVKVFLVNTAGSIYTSYANTANPRAIGLPSTSNEWGNLIVKTDAGNYAGDLSMWGVVFNVGTWSGFAMPFIGDLEDSARVSTDKGL